MKLKLKFKRRRCKEKNKETSTELSLELESSGRTSKKRNSIIVFFKKVTSLFVKLFKSNKYNNKKN